MDIKSSVIKLAVDADSRQKILRQFPDIFNDYSVHPSGQVYSKHELKAMNRELINLRGDQAMSRSS